MLEGLTKILEILANKVSRKAAIIAIAMILVYMIAAAPEAVHVGFIVFAICFLAIVFTVLQWVLDYKQLKKTGIIQSESEEDLEQELNLSSDKNLLIGNGDEINLTSVSEEVKENVEEVKEVG